MVNICIYYMKKLIEYFVQGIVYVNGKNLGRYWSTSGPQFTLYLPGCYLKQVNDIQVFELEKAKSDFTIQFSDHHIFYDLLL